jgi:hypothetical protein
METNETYKAHAVIKDGENANGMDPLIKKIERFSVNHQFFD